MVTIIRTLFDLNVLGSRSDLHTVTTEELDESHAVCQALLAQPSSIFAIEDDVDITVDDKYELRGAVNFTAQTLVNMRTNNLIGADLAKTTLHLRIG